MSVSQLKPTPVARIVDAGRVIVGSMNPVKVAAVRAVLERAGARARVDGMAVASGVSDQPFGDAETIRGATQRAQAVLDASDADFAVGLEGGVVDEGGVMRSCAWAAVVSRDGRVGTGGSLAMTLPARVAALVRQGTELGHAMDRITGSHDTKHGAGAVGILTAGLVDRQRAYEALVTYALARFLTPELYDEADS
ncbi:MAG TPA: inosine/xanthosine triphosphatase [Gemmatimonadaceae bacterium]|nr:inosine/xanthosine triphosphatase [Gemmatimonadaceae bacterium]